MSEVVLNGKPEKIKEPVTLFDLFRKKSIPAGKIAAELNGIIIPSDKFHETILKDGDHLEVIRIVGGG